MHLTAVPPLQPGCPWSTWARPNLKWCEDNLCAWVTTPANSWSNVSYVLGAALMWARLGGSGGRGGARRRPALRLFPPASLVVGLTSFLYHASYTWFFQLFDFVGMFFFCCVSTTLNARRLGQIDAAAVHRVYLVSVALCSMLFLVVGWVGLPVQLIVLSLVLLTLGQEAALFFGPAYRRHPKLRPRYRHFVSGMVLLVVAFACSVADATRLWCNPANHVVNGHAAWHVLTALVLYLLFLFHEQFDYDQTSGKLLPLAV